MRSPTRTAVRSGRIDMSATGLDVFDKTLQTTHIWLDGIMAKLGPDRQVAWHVLGAVLHALRDRLQIGLAVHLGAQLPLLVRGLYYDQWHPSEQTLKQRSAEQFLDHISRLLANRYTGATLRTCRLTRPRRPNFAHRFQSDSTREEKCHASQ